VTTLVSDAPLCLAFSPFFSASEGATKRGVAVISRDVLIMLLGVAIYALKTVQLCYKFSYFMLRLCFEYSQIMLSNAAIPSLKCNYNIGFRQKCKLRNY